MNDIDLLIDPTSAPVEVKKNMGLWPPSVDNIADSIYPYLKRLRVDKVDLLEVGTSTGENAYRFFELDAENKRIGNYETIALPTEDENASKIAKKNLENLPVKKIKSQAALNLEKHYDVVFINSEVKEPLDKVMKKYYTLVKHHGIFCGNNHHTTLVKEALVNFRREVKIGTPINVSNRLCWFWWVR